MEPRDLSPVQFSGTLTPEICERAARAMNRQPLRTMALLALAVGALLVVAAAGSLASGGSAGSSLLPLLVVEIILVYLWWQLRRAGRKLLDEHRLLGAATTGRADAERFEEENPYGTTRLPWEILHRSVVTPREVLLYQSPGSAFLVPREFFASDEDWRRFVELVRERAPQPPKTPLARWRSVKWLFLWTILFVALIVLYNSMQ